MVYLLKDEKRTECLFKVGYTKDIDRRMVAYATHNPAAELLDAMVTYTKTKMQLETAIHTEIAALGCEFVTAADGTQTEWFRVAYDSALFADLTTKGLAVFAACQGRKSLGGRG